jgi:phage shock protein A
MQQANNNNNTNKNSSESISNSNGSSGTKLTSSTTTSSSGEQLIALEDAEKKINEHMYKLKEGITRNQSHHGNKSLLLQYENQYKNLDSQLQSIKAKKASIIGSGILLTNKKNEGKSNKKNYF